MEYQDFTIHVGTLSDHAYPVDAQCLGTAYRSVLPRVAMEDEGFQSRLGQVAGLEADEGTVRELGLDLYLMLFRGDVHRGLLAQLARVDSLTHPTDGAYGLRLRLVLDAPELAALPWEFLTDENGNPFSPSPRTPVVRSLPLTTTMPLTVDGPLHLLVMASQPWDLPRLDVGQERERIEEALRPLKDRGLVDWEFAERATRFHLQRALMKPHYHVFHFIGHGVAAVKAEQPDSFLAFEDESRPGRTDPVTAGDLAMLLRGSSVRMVVLNACETASFAQQPFRALAPALVRADVPAVIAMQYAVLDRASVAFSRLFYTALAHDCPVDAAVCEGRKGMMAAAPGCLDWGIPVIYSRAPDGVLFRKQVHTTLEALLQEPADVEAAPTSGAEHLPRPEQEAVVSLREQLSMHRSRLAVMRADAARYGTEIPLHILNEVSWREREIASIKARLAQLGVVL